MAAGGTGITEHDGRRSMTSLDGTFADSRFDGDDRFGYVEVGTARRRQNSLWLAFVSLQGIQVETDAFTESSDSDFAVSVDGMKGESLRSMTGFSLSQLAPTPIGAATTQLRLGWLHEYLDESQDANTTLYAVDVAAQDILAVQSADTGRDWVSIGLQLDWAILFGGQLTTAYQGNINTQSAFHGGFIGSRWLW